MQELGEVIKAPQKLKNIIDIVPVLRAIPSRASVDLILRVVLRQLKRLDIGCKVARSNSHGDLLSNEPVLILPCDDPRVLAGDTLIENQIPVGFFDIPFAEFEIFAMSLSSIVGHDLFVADGGLSDWQKNVLDMFQEYLFRWGSRIGILQSALATRWPGVLTEPPLLMMQLERIGTLLARLAVRLAVARAGSRTSADVLLEALSGPSTDNKSTGQEAVKLVMPAVHLRCFLRLLNPDSSEKFSKNWDNDDIDSMLRSWVVEGKSGELTAAMVVDFLLRVHNWDLLNTVKWPEKSMVIKDSVTAAIMATPTARKAMKLPRSWTQAIPVLDSDDDNDDAIERTVSALDLPNKNNSTPEEQLEQTHKISRQNTCQSEPGLPSQSTAVSMVELLSALCASFLFQSVCLQNLLEIAQGLPVVRFSPGEVIFKPKDLANSFYLLLSGTVQRNKEEIISTVGSMFGGLPCIQNAIAERNAHSFDEEVDAVSPCTFVEVSVSYLQGLFSEQAPAAVAVKRNSLEYCLEVGSYWRRCRLRIIPEATSTPATPKFVPNVVDALRPLHWSMLQRAVVLRTCPLFQSLKPDEHSLVAKAFNAVSVESEQVLFQEGRPAEMMIVVVSGSIILSSDGSKLDPGIFLLSFRIISLDLLLFSVDFSCAKARGYMWGDDHAPRASVKIRLR